MLTQTAERQELLREIDTLPDSSVTAMLGFLRSLRSRNETSDWVDPIETGTWNAETMKAIRDVEEGRAERFESKEALFKDLRLCEEEAKARRNAAYLGKLERGLREIEEGKGIAMTFEDWERRFCNGSLVFQTEAWEEYLVGRKRQENIQTYQCADKRHPTQWIDERPWQTGGTKTPESLQPADQ